MSTLDQALRSMCEPTDTQYTPVRIADESEKYLVFMQSDYVDPSPHLLTSVAMADAIAEAETRLTEVLGMSKVVDWVFYGNGSTRSVWSYHP